MADFFGALGDRLSQGDIVANVPWGVIDAPFSVCRPDDKSKTEGKARYAPAAGLNPPFKGIELVLAKAQLGLGMVLWHDCQLDKFENQNKPPDKWFAAIAPVIPLQQSDAAAAQAVREGRRRAFFFLPAYPAIGLAKDSYVDLRYIWPMKQSLLVDRKGTLTQTARSDLYSHLFSFLTQRQLGSDVTCAHCGKPTPTAEPLKSLVDD
jgi:hypothetical protein